MEVGSATKLQCQRIGCNAMFTDDDNPDGSCQFHASVRLFVFRSLDLTFFQIVDFDIAFSLDHMMICNLFFIYLFITLHTVLALTTLL